MRAGFEWEGDINVAITPLIVLSAIFLVGAGVVWSAGIQLSKSIDMLSDHFGFGQALGGLIFLAIATNLPEIAITASAGATHNLDIATGNILGGIALQTVVLVLIDGFRPKTKGSLSYLTTSIEIVLEGILVIAVLVVSIMGTQLPKGLSFSDIFGGNAFLPVLFLLADVMSGQAVLPQAHNSDIYLAGLGCLLTAIYIYGLIFHKRKQVFKCLGIDSVLVLVVYIVATFGLITIAKN